jgi:hypothetical protein
LTKAAFPQIFIGILTLQSCVIPFNYYVVAKSQVSEDIDNVAIMFGSQKTGCGYLASLGEAEYCCIEKPVPEKVEVSWNTLDGEEYRQAVDVAAKVPDEFNMRRDGIVFTFHDDGKVTLSFRIKRGKYEREDIPGR